MLPVPKLPILLKSPARASNDVLGAVNSTDVGDVGFPGHLPPVSHSQPLLVPRDGAEGGADLSLHTSTSQMLSSSFTFTRVIYPLTLGCLWL